MLDRSPGKDPAPNRGANQETPEDVAERVRERTAPEEDQRPFKPPKDPNADIVKAVSARRRAIPGKAFPL